MTNRAESAKLGWPRWAQVLLIALLAMLAGLRLFSLADDAASRAGLLGEPTTIGGTFLIENSGLTPFERTVGTVEPGGPLDQAGVRAGDSIRTSRLAVSAIRFREGQRIPFELVRDGARSSGVIIVETAPQSLAQRQANGWLVLNRLAAIVTTLIGCFILWRGWGNKTAMLLGTVMIPMHVVGMTIPNAFSSPIASNFVGSLTLVTYCLSYFLLLFAMRQFQETAGRLPRWCWYAVLLLVAYRLIDVATRCLQLWYDFTLPFWVLGLGTSSLLVQVVFALSIVVLCVAWRRSTGDARNRNAAILLALFAYLLGALTGFAGLSSGTFAANPAASASLAIFNALTAGLLAPTLLAFAVLRHKLFDLGFAVNRTLVFGAVGVLLLVSFALIEWAIKQAIPKVWYGGSAYISAVIAVGLYLTFNRLHHKVEAVIERLFFHKWQVNEAALKRFVAAAGHMEQGEALAGHFTTELARFTGGAAVALHLRTAEGHYASAAGDTIDADDRALAAMRAELGPVVPAEVHSSLDAALTLPMMHQAVLAGFILLGPKPTGEDYRPDEIEVMAWATHQIGLDLQAIRVRELELSNIKLTARNQALSEMVAGATLAKA